MTNRIFISYAKEDKGFAEKLYSDLQQAGVGPWLDSEDLIPGQPWEAAIKKAISESTYFIAVLSSRSVGKTGTVNKEIRHALDIAEKRPEGKIFIVPVRIDECESPFEGLKKLHRADFFPSYEDGLKYLLRPFKYESEEKPLIKVDIRKQESTITRLCENGYGFIQKYGKEFFFHSSQVMGVTFEELRVGDIVAFSIAESPKGFAAVDVARA